MAGLAPSAVANSLRRSIHRLYLLYHGGFPLNRGKYRLGLLLERLLGPAEYRIGDATFLLSPLASIDRHLIAGQGHDQGVVDAILRALAGGGNFIDVGANFGYMSILAARFVGSRGTVFSFEPSPREFDKLMKHIRLNHLDNVVPFPVGVGTVSGKQVLYLANPGNPGMNSRYGITRTSGTVEAGFVPVHEVLSPDALQGTRVVKIDVEGDEMSVLRGFSESMQHLQRATFIVEISRTYLAKAGAAPEDIYDFFRSRSFEPQSARAVREAFQYDEVFLPPSPDGAAGSGTRVR